MESIRRVESEVVTKDLVVVGAGMSGICAAVQAARLGLKVALINDRGYLGGNASAEIRVPIDGASSCSEFNFYSRESGIILEILLENSRVNPRGNPYIWDAVLRDYLRREQNLEVFMGTYVDEVEMRDGNEISSVSGTQTGSERRLKFMADYFLDATGDGIVGYLAGAEYRVGRESRDEFGEAIAPKEGDNHVLASTLTFQAIDVGEPVSFRPPGFALDLTKTDVLLYREIPREAFYTSQWYYEVGGELDQVKDSQKIMEKHLGLVYGIWDYVKNSGKYNSENYDLIYVSCIPGKREYRRLMGDYILTARDLISQREFPDVVGYGGRAIDLHAIDGFFSKEPENSYYLLKGVYQIPYRCGYSKNIKNLFFAGRNMSTTHVAFGSTRVQATLCTLAQALGVAAYLCKANKRSPREVYEHNISDLQQLLLKEDQFVIGKQNLDENDKARKASITVSSVQSCELTKPTGGHPIDCELALIVPVRERVDAISVLIKNEAPGTLQYSAYVPDNTVNWSPDYKIKEGEIVLEASSEFRWVHLPINKEIKNHKIFIKIGSNDDLEIGTTDDHLVGVVSLRKERCKLPRVFDAHELKRKEYLWRKFGKTICFRVTPTQQVYGPENINNGYHRPYGLPNIWCSGELKDSERVEITFKQRESISELRLYFDPDFNVDYSPYSCTVPGLLVRGLIRGEKHVEHGIYSDLTHLASPNVLTQTTVPTLVKTYTVYARVNDSWQQVAHIEENHLRLNVLRFPPVETDKIRIDFQATNGVPRIHVFEIRAY